MAKNKQNQCLVPEFCVSFSSPELIRNQAINQCMILSVCVIFLSFIKMKSKIFNQISAANRMGPFSG